MSEHDVREQLRTLLSALDKLPAYRGLSYRGYDGVAPGRGTTVSPVLVASSLDPRVATENFSTNGLFAIIGSLGRALSHVSAKPFEREVVFRPGSMFLPIESFDHDGILVTVLEELDPDSTPGEPPEVGLDVLKERMRAEITAARERPPVEGVSPGKFVGPLN